MRTWLTVALLSALASARAVVAWIAWDAQLLPDSALYAGGGFGLYPSPFGRLVGLGGLTTIAVWNAAATGALVLVVALLARRLGGSPVLAALLALLTPLALWTMFASFDATGALFVLLAFLLWAHERPRWAIVSALLAVGFHLAVLPIVGAAVMLSGRSWRGVLAVAGCVSFFAVVMLLLTPYGGVMLSLDRPVQVGSVVGLTFLIVGLTYLPFARRIRGGGSLGRRALWACAIGTAAAVGLQASERASNARYALPLSMCMAAVVTAPRGARRRLVTDDEGRRWVCS